MNGRTSTTCMCDSPHSAVTRNHSPRLRQKCRNGICQKELLLPLEQVDKEGASVMIPYVCPKPLLV